MRGQPSPQANGLGLGRLPAAPGVRVLLEAQPLVADGGNGRAGKEHRHEWDEEKARLERHGEPHPNGTSLPPPGGEVVKEMSTRLKDPVTLALRR